MLESLTVYTLPNCMQCTMTTRALDAVGLAYVTVDLATDKDSVNLVTQLGYRSAPVVIAASEHWSGFRPDKISSIATAKPQAPASTTEVDA